MSTYAQLAASGSAKAVWWVEVSGLPWSFSDGSITEANKAALFTDAYTPTLTFTAGLMPLKESFSRSIELLTGKGTTGGLQLEFTDWTSDTYPSGFFTWLFGGERSNIGRGTLAEDIEIDETAWTLAAGWTLPDGGFAASQTGYCRLETIVYTVQYNEGSPTNVLDVTRSAFKSPSITHRVAPDGRYPVLTDHPTVWSGRIVTLYQTYMDGAGVLASTGGTPATARAAAKKFRGILRDVSWQQTEKEDHWSIRCDGIDTLLKRKILRGAARAPVTNTIHVWAGTPSNENPALPASYDATLAPVLWVELREMDAAAWIINAWDYVVSITAGTYSREDFVLAVNDALEAGLVDHNDSGATWTGTLDVSLDGGELKFHYRTSASARWCVVHMVMGVNLRPTATGDYWRALGIFAETDIGGEDRGLSVTVDHPAANTDYYLRIACTEAGVVVMTPWLPTKVAIGHNTQGTTSTSFAIDDDVIISSSDGVTLAKVTARTAPGAGTLGTVTVAVQGSLPGNVDSFLHHGTFDEPVEIRSIFYYRTQANLYTAVLRLLLSTGSSGFNHATYDTEAEGIGIAFPHLTPSAGANSNDSLIDVSSFIRFFTEAEAYAYSTYDFIIEPEEMLEWLIKRMAFFGGYLVVTNGQLGARRGLTPMKSGSTVTVTRKELLPGRNVTTGQAPTVDGVTYRYNYSYSREEFMREGTFLSGSTASEDAQNYHEYEDKGIRSYDDQIVSLGREVLAEFAGENWLWNFRVDRAIFVEPSEVLTMADEGYDKASNDAAIGKGAPNIDGTRGHTGTRLMVLESTADHAEQTTAIRAIQTRRNRSGFAASAWISSFTNVGAAVLTCEANVFRPAADGVDAGAFAAGDKVRIVRLNGTQTADAPTTSVQNGEVGLTIASIAGNAITLTGTLSGAYVSGTTPIALTLDKYETASQTTTAQAWCFVGDSSGDIDDGGDPAYEW